MCTISLSPYLQNSSKAMSILHFDYRVKTTATAPPKTRTSTFFLREQTSESSKQILQDIPSTLERSIDFFPVSNTRNNDASLYLIMCYCIGQGRYYILYHEA